MILNLTKKIGLTAATAIISGLFFYSSPANAQELLKNNLGEALGKVEIIGKIQEDQTLGNAEKDIQETEARKDALSKIFEITLLENKNLKEGLEAINNLTSEEQKIKTALLKSIEENQSAFQLMEERLREAETSNEIKQLASDLKNWRNLVYNPKAEKISAFNLAFQGKNIIAVANNRLNKIQEDLNRLSGDSDNFKWAGDLLYKAELKIKKADDLNLSAKNLIIQEINKSKNPGFFKKLFSKNQIPAAKSLIEELNQNIKDAYQIFIELGKAMDESKK